MPAGLELSTGHPCRPTRCQLGREIGRLMVAPNRQGEGLGRRLPQHIEAAAPAEAGSFALFTGIRSTRNQRIYQAVGFTLRPDLPAPATAIMLTKATR